MIWILGRGRDKRFNDSNNAIRHRCCLHVELIDLAWRRGLAVRVLVLLEDGFFSQVPARVHSMSFSFATVRDILERTQNDFCEEAWSSGFA